MFKRLTMWLALVAGLGSLESKAVAATNEVVVVRLKLGDYLQEVVRHNELVQAQMLEAEVNRQKHRAEYGIFEPQFTASADREANRRINNVLQQNAQNGQNLFNERNAVYDGGIDSLIPSGGKVKLGYTLSNLGNNLNNYGSLFALTNLNGTWSQQYQTFVGLSFSQPLLKDGGLTVTLAGLRLSALESDIAFQEYRRQLMLTVFRAEGTYWNLYFSQEQVHFYDQSVAVAQNVLDDTREKMKAGKGSELDVMEAQSALALRNTRRNDALQSYYEARGNLQILAGHRPAMLLGAGQKEPLVRVADAPRETSPAISYSDSFQQAFTLNPDYLMEEKKLDQHGIRLKVAKNQLLPSLNLKTTFGFNGLGLTPDDSWDMAQSQDYPSWSVGLEFSFPLGGNYKGRTNLKTARLSVEEGLMRMKSVQTEIANGINTAIQKISGWEQSIQSYQMVAHYTEELLKTQLERLQAGRVDAHKVLEVEANLLDARQELANALTQYQRALLQVELTVGSILKNRNLEVTREELQRQTRAWMHSAKTPASPSVFELPAPEISTNAVP